VNIRTILCPVNFSEVAREALENACALADALEAQLIVANVVERGERVPAQVEDRFHAWVDPLVRARTTYESVVVTGDPAQRVLEIADQTRADLIVLGAQHEFFSDATVIGTTTERVTRFARQPVLTIVRHAAGQKEVRPEALVTIA
ncbi:MAG TPA: universal stress protein, partial [Rhodanobacteraceae bacterium]